MIKLTDYNSQIVKSVFKYGKISLFRLRLKTDFTDFTPFLRKKGLNLNFKFFINSDTCVTNSTCVTIVSTTLWGVSLFLIVTDLNSD